MNANYQHLAAVLSLLLAACTHSHEPSGPQSVEAPQARTNRIQVPPAVRRNLGVTFADVEVRRVAQTLRVPGIFELQPRARREYRLPLPGRVEILVRHLDPVEAGDPLYRYQSPKWPELLHEIKGKDCDGTGTIRWPAETCWRCWGEGTVFYWDWPE